MFLRHLHKSPNNFIQFLLIFLLKVFLKLFEIIYEKQASILIYTCNILLQTYTKCNLIIFQARQSTSFLDKTDHQARENAAFDDMQSGGKARTQTILVSGQHRNHKWRTIYYAAEKGCFSPRPLCSNSYHQGTSFNRLDN